MSIRRYSVDKPTFKGMQGGVLIVTLMLFLFIKIWENWESISTVMPPILLICGSIVIVSTVFVLIMFNKHES